MPEAFSTSEKTVPVKKRDQSKRRAGYQPKFSVHGRPGKRTPELEKALLAAIETGAPYRIACAACSISEDSFTEWRRKDPVFAAQVEKAAGKTALRLLKKIEKCADENFSAAAWILERRFPSDFSRPEVQLNLIQQNNVNAGINGQAFQSIVVSDLEFSKLRENPSYQHRRNEGPVRDVEATIVEPNLSGTLVRADHPGCSILSQSQAAETERRVKQAQEKIERLMEGRRRGNGDSEPAASRQAAIGGETVGMVLTAIRMPAGSPPASWWSQLVRGAGGREIEKETAVEVCKIVLRETLGLLRAQRVAIEFGSEPVALSDVQAKIQQVAGPRGWSALLAKVGA
jgi:hypothetical protein